MKLLNFNYEILDTIYEINNGGYYYIYDYKTNIRYIGLILNNISNDTYFEIFDYYIYNKYNSLPFVLSPIYIEKIYHIDDFFVNTHSLLILFSYFEFELLSNKTFNNKEEKISLLNKFVFLAHWANAIGNSLGNISPDFILIDKKNYPFLILIKNNSNLNKDLYFLSNIANNILKINDYENIIKTEININNEIFNTINYYFNKNLKVSLDFFEPLKISINNIINSLNNLSNYLEGSIFNEEIKQKGFQEFYKIINLSSFPSSLFQLLSSYIEDISNKNNIIFLNLNGTPDKFSILYEFVEKASKNFYIKSFLDFNNIIISKLFYKSEDIIKFSTKKIINEILNIIEYITKSYKIIFFINNFDYCDKYSYEFISNLFEINNNKFIIFLNTIKFDYIKKYNVINFNHFINLDENKKVQEYFINFLLKFLFLNQSEKESLENINIDKLMLVIQNNIHELLIFKDNNITINQKNISNILLNKEINIIFNLIKNIDLKTFSLYLYYFDKPPKIEYFKNIEGHNLIPIINFLIKNKILINIEDNRFLPADIRITRMLVLEFISQKHNKKKIIENICKIYLENFDILTNNEIYALIFYLVDLKKYDFASDIFYKKILYNYIITGHFINEKEYYQIIKKIKNRTKNFKKNIDEYSKIIFQISYLIIFYKNNENKFLSKIDYIYETYKNSKNVYLILFLKLYFLINHGKISESISLIQEIDKYKELYTNTDIKLYYFLINFYYFINFKPDYSIQTSKTLIKYLFNFNEIYKEKELYLDSVYKITYSLLYKNEKKRLKSYLNYFYKIAYKFDNKIYIYRALSNLGIFYYRNKNYNEALIYLNKAHELSPKLFDDNLYFVSLNNKNLLEININEKIINSYKALLISRKLQNINYFALAICNYVLNCYHGYKLNNIDNIINKYFEYIYNKDIFYNNNYFRRILQFSIIISNYLIINDKKEYIKKIFLILLKYFDNVKNDKSIITEIIDLYNFATSFYKYICYDLLDIKIENNINEEYHLNNINKILDFKNLIKETLLSKEKLLNIDLFYEILFDYGIKLVSFEEIYNLLNKNIKEKSREHIFIPQNIIVYLRIFKSDKNKKVLIKYIEKYFKLTELDFWFSSGNYVKLYVLYFYTKLLYEENSNLLIPYIYKLNNLKNNCKKIYFNNELFSHYIELYNSIDKFLENFKTKKIKLFYIDIDKNYYNYVLNFNKSTKFEDILFFLLNDLNFDRIVFFESEDNNFVAKYEHFNKKLFYLNKEPIKIFWQNNTNKLLNPNNLTLKNSEISQIITIPIYNNKYYKRYMHDQNNIHHLLYGFIYLDKKSKIKTIIDYNHLYLLTILLSNYYISLKNETSYMIDKITNVYLRDVFINKTLEFFEKNYVSKIHCLLMIDIDDFKKINDSYGHQKGDDVLKLVANTIKSSLRSYDIIGRYGGEEFIVFLPNTDIKNAFFISERIRKNIESLKIHGINTTITISIGISQYPEDGFILDELINKADKAMYFAKNLGKNRSIVYQE